MTMAIAAAAREYDYQAQLDAVRQTARSPEEALRSLEALLDALPLARACRRRIARGGDAAACEAPETPEEADEAVAVLAGALDAMGMARRQHAAAERLIAMGPNGRNCCVAQL